MVLHMGESFEALILYRHRLGHLGDGEALDENRMRAKHNSRDADARSHEKGEMPFFRLAIHSQDT